MKTSNVIGRIGPLLIMFIAVGLTIASISYQRAADPFCRGLLSAGFPLAVVCDASGESPLSSVGVIDWADSDSISYLGTLVDIVLYAAPLWLVWRLAFRRFMA